MPDTLAITPVGRPIHGSIRPPGSKSLTNRALVVAALADGRSSLSGVLNSRDTQVMIESLGRLGIGVQQDTVQQSARVDGCTGRPPAKNAELWLENSGTSIRFLTGLCALGTGEFRLDGNERMRERPLGDLANALGQLGADLRFEGSQGFPPVVVQAHALRGGTVRMAGDVSSQFLSALLMVAPCVETPVEIALDTELVSRPYVDMTIGVMKGFGVSVEEPSSNRFVIRPRSYQGTDYDIEPDASAASYFFALAAITGGTITVEGLSHDSLQGDVRFVDVLCQMGCHADYNDRGITLTGGRLAGVDVDMNDISDTAQTLAVVAVFAEGATRVRNIGHVRHKETDRIRAVTTELTRAGINVEEHDDGWTIHPGVGRAAIIQTYDDHRMAMSFSLLGMQWPGIEVADPGCTSKTYPGYFDDLAKLCRESS